MKRIYKDDQDNMIFGVCGGIADALNIDPTIVRIIFATLMFIGKGYVVLFYFIYAIVAPTKSSVKLDEMQKKAMNKEKEKGDE